jgi:enamine deaminase RidA (YjgF/YER057c/UK114 family)
MPAPGSAAGARRLEELGLALPERREPGGALRAVIVHGARARTSGQLPRAGGALQHPGRLGEQVSVEQGREAARHCVLNALSALDAELGGLDRIERVLSLLGFVACTPDFTEQPRVLDAASELLTAVFGELGTHSRSAIGVAALPRGACVEIELEVAVVPTASATSA